jgi:hypothetical protein
MCPIVSAEDFEQAKQRMGPDDGTGTTKLTW